MWTPLPYIDLFLVIILLVLSINTVTTMGAPVGDPENTNEQEGNNSEGETGSKSRTEDDTSSRNITPCWEIENYTVLSSCASCHPFITKVFSESCEETGFNQLVHCLKSDQKVYKSCPKSRETIEKSFWVFEGVMFFIGLVSGLVVFCRRRKLNREAADRVRKQISNSV